MTKRRPVAFALLLAAAGCATSRASRDQTGEGTAEPPHETAGRAVAAEVAAKAGLEGVTFTDGTDGRARTVHWHGTVGYHPVTTWLEVLGGPLPAGCSLRLALARARTGGDRVLLDGGGILAPDGAADRPCPRWQTIVGVLDGIASAIPDRAWTTSLVQEGEALEIVGIASTEDVARDFARALEASGRYAAVTLASAAPAEELSTSTPSLIRFRLALRLRE